MLFGDPIAIDDRLKCSACQNKIKKNVRYKNCYQCEKPFEIKCSTKSLSAWMCLKCLYSHLPFNNISNDDMHLSLHGLCEKEQEFLKDLPNFDIKTLIDSLPGFLKMTLYLIQSFLNTTLLLNLKLKKLIKILFL